MVFIAVEKVLPDKTVSVFIRNLEGEKDYQPHLGNADFDSERSRANLAVLEANEELGRDLGISKAFSNLFNQFNRRGTTGWEYGKEDYVLVLRHALKVAEKLHAKLHVHKSAMSNLILQLSLAEITFDMDNADQNETLRYGDEAARVTEKLQAGEYFVISNLSK